MRYLLIALLFLGFSSYAIYAADIPSAFTQAIGGTGDLNVSSPATGTVTVSPRTFDLFGALSVMRVTWEPNSSGTHTIKVVVKDQGNSTISSGSATVNVTASQVGTTITTDVTMSPAVTVSSAEMVTVVISK